jgi:hypothetical protein
VNAELLIDSIVRQTMVSIAEIATATESRPQLARTADDIFRSLVEALRSQGVTNKAIADMFGLTLRTYHNRVARLAEADAQRDEQLREAILKFIEERKSVRKAQVIDQFRAHEPVMVVGLLRDLVSAELVFQSGSGHAMAYRIARSDELPPRPADDDQRLERLLWVAIQRFGPIDLERLLKFVPATHDVALGAVDRLVAQGRVTASRDANDTVVFSSDECFIAPEDPTGWEAAVFDHFQAVVATLAARLRIRAKDPDDWTGGGTFSFEVWRGHPMFDEAVGLLSQTRSRARALRERIRDFSGKRSPESERPLRVVFYLGQSLIGNEEADEEESDNE